MLAANMKKKEQQAPKMAVVGIGNVYRKDDAAGLLVAREVKAQLTAAADSASVQVSECTGGSFELIDAWEGVGLAIIVDAVSSGADPGTVFRIEARNQPVPSYLFHYSTHGFNIAHTIELARLLGKLPQEVVIFGIEGADFGNGPGLSEDVTPAIERVTRSVLACLRDYREES